MGSSIFNQAAEFLRENKTAKRALGIMVCLALLVALGTVGVLTSTGQAMTQKVKTLDCSFAVHQHTNDCYDGAGNLVCGRADYVVHVHNDDCRNEAGEIVCPLPEVYPHTHSDECWQDVTELVCGQTEDLGHTHSEACYSYELTDELICGLEEHTHDAACYRPTDVLSCEIAEHSHNEECYDENGALICETPEHTHDGTCYTQGQELICEIPEHSHTDACYKQNATLTCGLEERPAGHVHTDACYKTEHVLVCDKLELHEHTEDCYAHDEAGNRLDLICGQIELLEHTHDESCFKIEEVPVVEQSEPSEAPAYVCGLEEHTHSDACYDAESGELICTLEEHVHDASCLPAVALPLPGETPDQETYCGLEEHTHDEACYDEAGQLICGLEEHTHDESCFAEPVVYYCGLEEHTHSDACYDENNELICGLEEHTHTDACLEQIIIQTAEDQGIRVIAAYGPKAGIPAGAELRVSRILHEGADKELFEQRSQEATDVVMQQEGLAVSSTLALMDIGFYLPDGTEVEPSGADQVTVTMQFLDETGAAVGEAIRIVHFTETGAELVETTTLDADQAATFTADGFSTYGAFSTYETMTIGNPMGASVLGTTEQFDHKKQIDYLGDNKYEDGSTSGGSGSGIQIDNNNPDTDADDDPNAVTDDLYRLYLDIEGRKEPVDLLLIVDRSSSMKQTPDGTKTHRAERLIKLLNGTDGQQGLIAQFLAQNKDVTQEKDKNHVAVVWYAGRYKEVTKTYEGNTYSVRDMDAVVNPYDEGGVSLEWTSALNTTVPEGNLTAAPLAGATYDTNTTNYVAGLVRARDMLEKAAKNPNLKDHRKVVIFISDGLPTQYYDSKELSNVWAGGQSAMNSLVRYGGGSDSMVFKDVQGKGTLPYNEDALIYKYAFSKDSTFTASTAPDAVTGLPRSAVTAGNQITADQSPYIAENKIAFDLFKNNLTQKDKIQFFTLGIDLNTKQDDHNRTDVMKYMAGDDAHYLNVGITEVGQGTTLENALRQIIFPSNVTITDELSAYVDFYQENPDIKVTARNTNDPDTIITLWEGEGTGHSTDANKAGLHGVKPVVQDVTVDGKFVTVHFNPNYALGNDYVYTLSFNVKVTEQAFDEYADNWNKTVVTNKGYLHTGGNGEDIQSGNTDYGGNTTSTEKPGFFSNAEAKVTYKVDNQNGELPYDVPVVQVWRSDLTLVKKDNEGKLLENVAFRLERSTDSGNTWSEVSPKDTTVNQDAPAETVGGYSGYYLTDSKGKITYGNLRHGQYRLQEYVPTAYTKGETVQTAATFTVAKGRITTDNMTGVEEFTSEQTPKVNTTNTNYSVSWTFTLVNEIAHPDFSVYKYYKDGGDEAPLKGAEFTLYKYVEKEAGYDWMAIKQDILSDENGFLFKNNDGYDEIKGTYIFELETGRYCLQETKKPDHYVQLTEKIYFKVDGTGITLTDENGVEKTYDEAEVTGALSNQLKLTIYNDKVKSQAKLVKVDVATKEGLPGAQFELYEVLKGGDRNAATLVWKGTSVAQGEFQNEEIVTGEKAPDFPVLYAEKDYYLVETVVPAGYDALPGEIRLTVAEDGTVDAQLLVNNKPEGSMVDVKKSEVDGTTVYTIAVENSSGYRMPRTGGEGVTLYLLGGATLVTFAGAMLLLKRRKKNAA